MGSSVSLFLRTSKEAENKKLRVDTVDTRGLKHRAYEGIYIGVGNQGGLLRRCGKPRVTAVSRYLVPRNFPAFVGDRTTKLFIRDFCFYLRELSRLLAQILPQKNLLLYVANLYQMNPQSVNQPKIRQCVLCRRGLPMTGTFRFRSAARIRSARFRRNGVRVTCLN
ncbi:hypothetical protein BDV29DRAFT_72618 [Aspergillus leporis]|uniref:Uncharacterized protein n=1 Tax=Aspergillus leporis TaxID=41062 RepID=A0A5N5WKP8_9EURO|nr:hypothetical protein BDV29DRAFT_72618 [Aspergillus leporis]